MKLAFAGMGIMGSAMAANLLKAGHEVTVWNRSAEKCRPLQEAGAKVARSLPETADGAEIVFLCVSDTPDVEAVLFGEGGLAEGLSRGQIVVLPGPLAAAERIAVHSGGRLIGLARLAEPAGALPALAPARVIVA